MVHKQAAPHVAESQAPAHMLLHPGDGVLIKPGRVVLDAARQKVAALVS
jgi:hypothetical protein